MIASSSIVAARDRHVPRWGSIVVDRAQPPDDDAQLDLAAVLRLPATPFSASEARRFISDFCAAAKLPDEMCQNAALLVSELVTNAILHGRTSATIEVHRPADTLRVAVRDDNPVLPPVGDQPSLNAESGRGLMIVSMLAHRWGVERTEAGKSVWFELSRADPKPADEEL